MKEKYDVPVYIAVVVLSILFLFSLVFIARCSEKCPPCPKCEVSIPEVNLTEDEKKMKRWAERKRGIKSL